MESYFLMGGHLIVVIIKSYDIKKWQEGKVMEQKYNFKDFTDIIRTLRSENGCPWDREQTHESLKPCMIEECYEVVDAINNKDMFNFREELGDVLLQVVMHAVIAEETDKFTIDDVIQDISEKMIRRHPHVFGTGQAETAEDVLQTWEQVKKEEKQEYTGADALNRIPKALPANIRAQKVQKKAAKFGMEFENCEQVLDKVYEELRELEEAVKLGNNTQIEEEFGDLMFSIINLSRFLHINAENSLTNATDKFINRFVGVEDLAIRQGRHLNELSPEQLDVLWREIKSRDIR